MKQKYNCIILCALGYEATAHVPELLSSSWPRFKSIVLSL